MIAMWPIVLILLVSATSSTVLAQNAPRISCALFSTTQYPESDFYRTALYLSMRRLQNQNGLCSYRALALLHGQSSTYNGVRSSKAPGEGFCPHSDPAFCAWHRFYACAVETCLIEACFAEAALFTTQAGRDRMRAACNVLRLPYWDWTRSQSVCTFATATTVRVVAYSGVGTQTLSYNPWRQMPNFRYRRSSNNVGSATCRTAMTSFINSRNVNCLHTQSVDRAVMCLATNLEECHDWIHVVIGGYMNWVPDAPFDPIFQLHHTCGDYLVSLYQAAQGVFTSAGLAPWANIYTNATQMRCGSREYYYYTNTTNPYPNLRVGAAAAVAAAAAADGTGDVAAAEAAQVELVADVVQPSAAEVQAQLATFVGRMLQGTGGFTWYFSLPRVHCNQHKQAWSIHVLLKGRLMPQTGRAISQRMLNALPNYCGGSQLLTCVHKHNGAAYVDVNVDINRCLTRMGRNPQVGLKEPGKPEKGPVSYPAKIADFVLLLLGPDGKPIKAELPENTLEHSYTDPDSARAVATAAVDGTVSAASLLPQVYTSQYNPPEVKGVAEILQG